MNNVLKALLSFIVSFFRTRVSLQLEILAIRHQLAVCRNSINRPRLKPADRILSRLKPADRILWAWLPGIWSGWEHVLTFVQPATVIRWRRRRFRQHWARLSRSGKPGRPKVGKEVRVLIRRMSSANLTWGSPRICGELAKIGITVSKSTVERYMVRRRKPPSPTWRAFLTSHIKHLASVDFFIVPTVRFKVLFVFVVLAHYRRRVIHFNVTEHPTAEWSARQIVEAFPWDTAPRYLLRDRDGVYGSVFRNRVKNMAIKEVLIAPRSPWQNPYVERLIGSIRRECLDHMIVLNEHHLRRTLKTYFDYYHRSRVHQSLDMDCPEPRPIYPPETGRVVEIPEVGGLHHRYERRAA
jgi:transposase InsO family protein